MARWQFETERLIVREPVRRDVGALGAVFDRVAMTANGWTTGQRRAALLNAVRGRLLGQVLVVCTREGRPIGTVHVDLGRDPRSIGLILGPQGRGQGFGYEAMRAALPYFSSRGGSKLILETDIGNAAMRRIAERLGGIAMTEYVHTLPNGESRQAVRYALLPQPGEADGRA
jgi:RimJ/RimL family protein N-acetyltransferase